MCLKSKMAYEEIEHDHSICHHYCFFTFNIIPIRNHHDSNTS